MTKLLDLTNNEVRLDDVVAYVYQNKHGKTLTKVGIVVGESNKGLKIMTENGLICVKNVIKLNDNVLDDCTKYVLKETYKEKFHRHIHNACRHLERCPPMTDITHS